MQSASTLNSLYSNNVTCTHSGDTQNKVRNLFKLSVQASFRDICFSKNVNISRNDNVMATFRVNSHSFQVCTCTSKDVHEHIYNKNISEIEFCFNSDKI